MKSAQTTCPGDVLKDDKDVSVAKNIVSENTNRESTPKEETKNNTNNLKVSPQFLLLSTVEDY